MRRVLIAGTGSGCGKTTITCALLSAMKLRGTDIASFKCGPDYIDPMFHREVTGVPSRNLDPFFSDRDAMRNQLAAVAAQHELTVIEGVMGYYDGLAGTTRASTYEVAAATGTPVILVVNAKSAANSIGAVIEGFARHRADSGISGVIFNGISAARYGVMEQIALESGVRPAGYFPHNAELSLESRHLGLVTAAEISDIRAKTRRLGEIAVETVDFDALCEIADSAGSLAYSGAAFLPSRDPKTVIAVARDKAFCFIYEENIEMLERLGCEIRFFSPLEDAALPEGANGVYLCGGYPELYAEMLSANVHVLESIRRAITSGMPVIAECGGFMYLHESLGGYKMAGVIPGAAYKTDRLQRFGYATLTARGDSLLLRAGESVNVHEFHYWDSENPGAGLAAKKAGNGAVYECAHVTGSMYAGFPHLYFPGKPDMARRFYDAAVRFDRGKTEYVYEQE